MKIPTNLEFCVQTHGTIMQNFRVLKAPSYVYRLSPLKSVLLTVFPLFSPEKKARWMLPPWGDLLYSLRPLQSAFAFPVGRSFVKCQACTFSNKWSSDRENCCFPPVLASSVICYRKCKLGQEQTLDLRKTRRWSDSFHGVNIRLALFSGESDGEEPKRHFST